MEPVFHRPAEEGLVGQGSSPPSADHPAKGRVVFFSPSHHEPGGAERRARLIASKLAERGWDVRVLSRGSNQRRFQVRRARNLAVLEVPNFEYSRLGTVLYLVCSLGMGLRWASRDSVLLALHLYAPFVAAGCCGQLARRPYVGMATTSGSAGEAESLQPDAPNRGRWSGAAYTIDRRLRRALLSRASFVLAQTDAGAEELRQFVPPDRVKVMPSPVTASPRPLRGTHTALFAGTFQVEKDLLRLLDAWRAVCLRVPDARLTLVGGGRPGDMISEIKAAVARDIGLSETVEVREWVSDVAPLLERHDVFVLPSLTEGMSNALVEACAWGRVVVASDIGANRFVLGASYPLLFPAGDTSALASVLERALVDEDVRADARRLVLERALLFAVEPVMDRLEEILLDALGRR
jgi:glycosyltransferase involved in cell wall biosynthesis